MSPYAEHLRKWLSFDGPAPADAMLRLNVGLRQGWLTLEEYRVLIDTPIGDAKINSPGGTS